MNNCIKFVRIEYTYYWGFYLAGNKSSYAISMVANNELYGQIIDKLESVTISLKV